MSATSGVNVCHSGALQDSALFSRNDHDTAHLASRRQRQRRCTGGTNANNPALQVLRYSALAFGVFYGFSHQRSINAANRVASEKRDYEHKQQLIQKAKEEFAKKKNPAPLGSTTGGREYRPPETCQIDVPGQSGAVRRLWRRERRLTKETVNQDPMGPNFDLEAYFNALVKESP